MSPEYADRVPRTENLSLYEIIARVVDERLDARLHDLVEPELDAWLTSSEAAEHLRISLGSLHNRTSKKAERPIPHHRDGGRLLFRRSELDAYVKGEAS